MVPGPVVLTGAMLLIVVTATALILYLLMKASQES